LLTITSIQPLQTQATNSSLGSLEFKPVINDYIPHLQEAITPCFCSPSPSASDFWTGGHLQQLGSSLGSFAGTPEEVLTAENPQRQSRPQPSHPGP